ncbi:lysophospholipase [Flavilitoribacter nigricans DSM 23189 = NBRC 102662]|uniref:Lysophospholipase n=2 Tax=Flavilitoribacter TaxID=2762562 RepID=A0A2D0N3J0_FLAN2|nr:lysophospholipase [Flavilitoribacter nigricans DSM 23189 = NBRC 102662]
MITDPDPPVNRPDTSTVSANAIHYLALGDSYTIGQSVPESDRFPVQLSARLEQDSFEVAELNIIARTGWTTDELLAGILKADPPDSTYNLVSLLIGVNNQYRGRSLENYQEEFTVLLLRALELAGGRADRVLVLSIPDYGVTPFVSSEEQAQRVGEEIDAFNDAAAQICLAYEVRFLNITQISRQAANDTSLIASDGLHPSGEMYAKWVDLMLPIVKAMF